MKVRPLRPEEAAAFVALRRKALAEEPHSFASSPADDRASSLEFVQAALLDADQVILGAFENEELVGMVGIYRDRHVKGRHKAHIWGMYVSPVGRGRGVGRALMEGALNWARHEAQVSHVHLVVSARTPVARRLYESLGFRCWGIEPAALCIEGELVDDEYLILVL